MGIGVSHMRKSLVNFLGVCFLAQLFSVALAAPGEQPTEIIVSPSGDVTGRTDANNIEAALEAVAPGGTVTLEPGEFFTSRPIVVKGFNGLLRGYGIDATSVEAVKTSKGNQEATFESIRVRWYDDRSPDLQRWHTMFYFDSPSVSLKVSSLTLKVLDLSPVWRCDFCWRGLDFLILVTMAEDVDTHFDNIRLQSNELGLGGGNLSRGIRLLGGASATLADAGPENWPIGDHSLTSSEISVQGIESDAGYAFTFARDSQLTFINNVVTSVTPIRLFDLDNSKILVAANSLTAEGKVARIAFRDASGLLLIQLRTQNPSDLLIEDNQFSSIGNVSPATFAWAVGLEIFDFSQHHPTLHILIQENEFHHTSFFGTQGENEIDLGPTVGVWTHGATGGVPMMHNTFHGSGWLGVAGGWDSRADTGWVLHGNNFSGMEVGPCHVCLGPQSQDWTVVGGGSSISVVDLGVSNSIVGVSDLRNDPPGPPLSEANRENRAFEDLF